MKYTIEGFSQQYAATLRKKVIRRDKEVEIKIDCTDLVILRWFVDFYPNMRKMIVDGREYAWVTHKKIMEDLPLIDLSKDGFISRMQKLVEFGILQYKFIKDGGGTFSLYTFGENYSHLIEDNYMGTNGVGVPVQSSMGVSDQTGTGVLVQTPTKDKSIKDKSIKDTKENNIKEIVDYLNEKAETKFRSSSQKTQSLIKARLNEKFTVDDFKKVIDNKVQEWKDTDMEIYLRPETLFGTKFEGYLNQKPIQKKNTRTTQSYTDQEIMKHNYTKEQINAIFDKLDDIEI